MSMKIDSVQSIKGPSPADASGSSGGDAAFKKVFEQVASNIFNSGQGMMKEAMEKMTKEDDEPDTDDPDSEPL